MFIEKVGVNIYHTSSMYDLRQIFSNNIKRLRKNKNLTQEQMAEQVGLQWKSIVNFEAGRNVPNTDNLQSICNKLNVSPSELFLVVKENENAKELIDKINILLNKMDVEKLEEIYRIVAVLEDKSHFSE